LQSQETEQVRIIKIELIPGINRTIVMLD